MLSKIRQSWECENTAMPSAWPERTKSRRCRRYAVEHRTWHVAAYTASNAAGATNADTPALLDSGVLYITNNHYLLQDQMSLIAMYAQGAALSRARIDSGNTRYYGQPYVRPINQAALPGSNPNIMLLWDNPFVLPPREEIAAQLSNTAGAPEQEYLLLWLMLNYQPAPTGPFWAVRLTGSTAVVAQKWTIEPFSLETALPSGTYWMVDSDLQSTNGIAHRWFFDTQFYRPGFLMFNTLGNRAIDVWRPGLLGTMNVREFVNDRLPALEVLANAADAAFEGYAFLKPATVPQIGLRGNMAGAQGLQLPYRVGA